MKKHSCIFLQSWRRKVWAEPDNDCEAGAAVRVEGRACRFLFRREQPAG